MKRLSVWVALCFFFLLGDPGRDISPPTTTPRPTTSSWASHCLDCPRDYYQLGDRALQLDSQGQPHLLYAGDQLYYAHYVNNNWLVETIAEAPGLDDIYQQGSSTLVLDQNDQPHLAYFNRSLTALYYGYKTNNGWAAELIDTPIEKFNYDVGLALTNQQEPCLAYAKDGVLVYSCRANGQWQRQTVDAPGLVEFHISLALDGKDTPHISYYNHNRTELKYATWADGSWQIKIVDNSAWLGEFNSIAVDSQNRPHISYIDYTNERLKYAKWADNQWQLEVVGEISWFGGFSSLVLDGQDRPHISYTGRDQTPSYAHWTGQEWLIESLDSQAWYTSLALGGDEQPFMAYYRWADRTLQLATWDSPAWQTQTVDWLPTVGDALSLALDGQDRPAVAYLDSNRGELKWATRPGNVWQLETIAQVGQNGGLPSLALDSSGRAHLSYYNGLNQEIAYAYHDGQSWQVVSVMAPAGPYTALALDHNQQPHLAFAGPDYLGYAQQINGVWVTETVVNQVVGDLDLALTPAGLPIITFYLPLTGDLKDAAWNGNQWQIETIDSIGNVGANQTLALDSSGRVHISYYDQTNRHLKYAYHNGNQWQTETIDNDNKAGLTTDLVLDSSGRAHILYFVGNGELRYNSWDGQQWQQEQVAAGLATSQAIGLQLTSQEAPFVVYHDGGYRDLRYALRLTLQQFLPIIP